MMTAPRHTTVLGLLAFGATLLLPACGGDSTQSALPPAAEEGRSIAKSNGCGSCHGSSGQGGVGPAFVGLFGSVVQLDDGSSITADRAYLLESIKQPGAKKVDGYRLPMPTNRLTDDEIDRVITYIEALATTAEPREANTP